MLSDDEKERVRQATMGSLWWEELYAVVDRIAEQRAGEGEGAAEAIRVPRHGVPDTKPARQV